MIIAIIIATLSLLTTNLLIGYAFFRYAELQKVRLLHNLKLYFESPGENQPSEFSKLIDIIADTAGHKTALALKTTFMGKQSVESKNEQRVEDAINKDLIYQANPLIGMAMDSFPFLKKQLKNRPELMPMALEYLKNKGNGQKEQSIQSIDINEI